MDRPKRLDKSQETCGHRSVIDSHCHIDQYDDPECVAKLAERHKVLTVAVTNLPSHYLLAVEHLSTFTHVQPALGLHPLLSSNHARELSEFVRLASHARHIGEIGLDFSRSGRDTRDIQVASFRTVLSALKWRTHGLVTVHSRAAEDAVLDCLDACPISSVCFHWYSGPDRTLKRILDAGHLLSFNPSMIASKRWTRLFRKVPRDRVLTETDGPFTLCNSVRSQPTDIRSVLEWIASQWDCSWTEAEGQVAMNFARVAGRHQK